MPDFHGVIVIAVGKHALSDLYRGSISWQPNQMATGNYAGRVDKVKSVKMHWALLDFQNIFALVDCYRRDDIGEVGLQ